MAPAATTAAAVSVYAGAGTALVTLASAAGTAGWFLAGFGKVKCPACEKKVRARDFHEHAVNHPYDCRTCNKSVPFADMDEHIKSHGYSCPLCNKEVPVTEMDGHVNNHGYPCPRCKVIVPLGDMDEHFQIHAAEEDEYSRRRQEVAVLWGFLKAECPVCKESICLRDVEGHAAIHWMIRDGNARRQEGLANMQGRVHNRARGFKVGSLVMPHNDNLLLYLLLLLSPMTTYIRLPL